MKNGLLSINALSLFKKYSNQNAIRSGFRIQALFFRRVLDIFLESALSVMASVKSDELQFIKLNKDDRIMLQAIFQLILVIGIMAIYGALLDFVWIWFLYEKKNMSGSFLFLAIATNFTICGLLLFGSTFIELLKGNRLLTYFYVISMLIKSIVYGIITKIPLPSYLGASSVYNCPECESSVFYRKCMNCSFTSIVNTIQAIKGMIGILTISTACSIITFLFIFPYILRLF